MDSHLILNMAFEVIGGLTIFLLGMHNMSTGMQAVAGDKLRQLIHAVTNNRIMAVFVGFSVTAIIQSSSVTSVMVVGFVNAGLMTLKQALGIIVGANIGTTITGWMLVLQVGKYGLPTLGISGLFYLFSKKDHVRYTSMMIMGIGMVFFGLELMKNGFKPIREIPQFLDLFAKFTPDTISGLLFCAFVGAFVTAVVQSSSATVGITMSMASTGIINFETSVALVLGMNIGTTITAFLASLGTTTNAKRSAYGHIIFNTLGVLMILPLFPFYIKMVPFILKLLPFLPSEYPGTSVVVDGVLTFPYICSGIAIAHSTFNFIATLAFIPFISHFSNLLIKLVPDKKYEEEHHLTNLDIRMLDTPILVLEQSKSEILHMGEHVHRMLECLRDIISNGEAPDELVKKIFHREEILDSIQKEISTFLVNILSGNIPHNLVDETHIQIRIADEYESVSDYITSILKLYLKLQNAGITLSETKKSELLDLHEIVVAYFVMVDNAIVEGTPGILPKVRSEGNAITHSFRDKRSKHLERLSNTKMDPLLSVTYINMLNSYRKIRDHVLNIAEALAGEK